MPNTATKMPTKNHWNPWRSTKAGKAAISLGQPPDRHFHFGKRMASDPPAQKAWQTGKLNFFSDATTIAVCAYGAN
jgi:hypothetical protein